MTTAAASGTAAAWPVAGRCERSPGVRPVGAAAVSSLRRYRARTRRTPIVGEPVRRHRALDLLLLTVAAWAVTVVPANAYIDAGSVSVIFQGLVAALAAGWFAVKLGWGRLASLFRRGDGETVAVDAADPTEHTDDVVEPVHESPQR